MEKKTTYGLLGLAAAGAGAARGRTFQPRSLYHRAMAPMDS